MKSRWQNSALGEICDFQRGLTYAKGDEVESSGNVVLRATNIDLTTNLLNLSELRYIRDDFAVPDNKKVRKGSLMICTASGSKSHLGKVAYIDEDYGYAFGGFMGMITAKRGFVPKYLFHLMTSEAYKGFIGELSDGANINNLRFDELSKFQVPYPCPSEQERIVGILDDAFDGIAAAKANAERNLQNAQLLFESVLAAAAIGQLTEEWRADHNSEERNAQSDFFDLLKRIEREHRKVPRRSEETTGHEAIKKAMPKEWPLASVGVLFNIIDYQGKNPPRSKHGRRLITAKNIKMGYLSDEPITFISEATYSRWMVRGFPRRGDILFVTEGHTMGFAALNTRIDDFALAQRTITLQPTVPLSTKFFFYFILSPYFQNLVRLNATGAAAVGMKASKFRSLPLPFPSFAEQSTIVATLDALRDETRRLESIYRQKLAALEELKKSLLHQAFSGQL